MFVSELYHKGQENSVGPGPCYLGQNISKIFAHILGNATTSYFHSEISSPLYEFDKGAFTYDVRCFGGIFDLHIYLP